MTGQRIVFPQKGRFHPNDASSSIRAEMAIFISSARVSLIGAHKLLSDIAEPEKAPEVYSRLAQEDTPPLGIVFDWRKFHE